jgi:SAM-dependent methyltransferase
MTVVRRGASMHAGYWETVIAEWRGAGRQPLWRAHSDAVNQRLCDRWWPATRVGRLLKTDLFDEVSAEGLLPSLRARTRIACSIDRSIGVTRLARTRLGSSPATAADVRRLPFAAGAFDLVISNSTLDHFDRRAEIADSLREIHRVMAPEARLILTLDNAANPIVAVRNLLPFWLINGLGLVPYYVGVTCGPWRAAKMLTDAGFAIDAVTAVTHCPRVLAVAAAALCARLGSAAAHRRFLRLLMAFEKLEHWTSRYQTGYYVAFLARKAGAPSL